MIRVAFPGREQAKDALRALKGEEESKGRMSSRVSLEGNELTVVCPTAELENINEIRAELAAQTGLRIMVVCFSVEDERELDFDSFLAAYPSPDPAAD